MSGHKTQSAQISQKQNGHNVYVYVIMKTRCLPSYHHNPIYGNFHLVGTIAPILLL